MWMLQSVVVVSGCVEAWRRGWRRAEGGGPRISKKSFQVDVTGRGRSMTRSQVIGRGGEEQGSAGLGGD